MRFLVGTHSFLLDVKLTADFQLSSVDPVAEGHHYGITYYEDRGRTIIQTMTRAKNEVTNYELTGNRETLKQVSVFRPESEFHDIHQIARQQGGLYVANTGFNSLDYVKPDGEVIRYFIDGRTEDVNHINSVSTFNGNQALALLHNRSQRDAEIIAVRRSEGCISLTARFPVWDTGCHNIFSDGNILAYNASGKGDVVIVDLVSQRIVKRMHFRGHTKGMAVTDDYLIVGYADHAQREKRYTSRGFLAIVDRNNWRVLAKVDLNADNLPHPVGNVNEVRCISHHDYGFGTDEDLNLDWAQLRLSADDGLHQLRVSTKQLLRKLIFRPAKVVRRKVVHAIQRIGF